MFDLLLNEIAALDSNEIQNILTVAGESVVHKYKETHSWKKLLVDSGKFFIENEQEESAFFKDLELVLSKENLSQIAKDLKAEDGYDLKHRLSETFMKLMNKYEIPSEFAAMYTERIIYVILEQLRTINPEKYEHYFLQEWRDEQENSLLELQKRIDKMSNDLISYEREQVAIEASGKIDIELRRSTQSPIIGIDFFIIDDQHFQDKFEEKRYEEIVYVRGRSREETIYCILNELWRLNDKRPIYVVKNMESWCKLQTLGTEGNVYIPWFYADEIVAIENNTNIFVLNENTPVFNKSVLELRPRTRDTLLRCLQDAGMKYEKASALLTDTHGLYTQMKKQMFKGVYLKKPSWIEGISEKAKKTCLLIGSWEEIDGDKLIIETLYGDSYDKFLDEILPYTKGEDSFIYMIKHNGSTLYCLASLENIWSYLNVLTSENIWKKFVEVVLEVINEAESLFTYNSHEKLLAEFNGERLFWSKTIRKGMLKTLLIKGAYKNDEETQLALDELVEEILKYVTNEKQWIYISDFWRELCEISPEVILKRLECELSKDTGLLSLFKNQSNDLIFGKNAYIDILWGIEQFLCQKQYFWDAFRWILKIDSYNFEYKSNSPKIIFDRIFCTWKNFSSFITVEDKICAAKIAFEIDTNNTWDYLFSAIDKNGGGLIFELSSPKYRDYSRARLATIDEIKKTNLGYYKILISHMDFSIDRWKKMINLSDGLSDDLRRDVFEKLMYELNQMTDEEIMQIKNEIRHFIFKHRFFASSDWAISDEKLAEYEKLLNNIRIKTPEYEYVYLFLSGHDYPLLHPIPYGKDGEYNENGLATQELIRKKLIEFQQLNYDLTVLADICSKESYSLLGNYLSKYWNDGKWDYVTFKNLLKVQNSSVIAIDYIEGFGYEEHIPYNTIINDLLNNGYSNEILAKVYRVEAGKTKDIPLVTYAIEPIKKEFWKHYICCDEINDSWVLKECKKYSMLEVYINQMHQIHYRHPLSAEQIYECFIDIEKMPHESATQMTSYYLEQLIAIIQDAFIDDTEKCIRISYLEFFFMNLLEWKNMKCYQHMIKLSPELFAQLVASIFKKDHAKIEGQTNDQIYIHNMYKIYDKAHFCPAEENGVIDEERLEQWIEKYKQLLIENDQESLFTTTLGRLFSFSPMGKDDHEPCEAIRRMIEKYGDDKMISRYQTAVYNRRGVFSPSAGKEEFRMAEKFKENARYLEPYYPKTAKIFYGLYETYKKESERERMDAENGKY